MTGPLRLSPEAAVELERQAAIDHARAKIAGIQRAKSRGRLDAELAEHLVRCFDEYAVDLDQGLHL